MTTLATPTQSSSANTTSATISASELATGPLSTLTQGAGLLDLDLLNNEKYTVFSPGSNVQSEKQPALTVEEVVDRALFADPELPNLLPTLKLASQEIRLKELSPKFGSVVKGVRLTDLVDNPKAKDEFALLLAQRGVLVLHDQEDFFALGPEKITEFASYFGPLHEHILSNGVGEHAKLLPLTGKVFAKAQENALSTTSTGFHSDVTYELQPPGYTFLALLLAPPSGGDTVFVDTREAYDRLSPGFQQRLEGLTATHTSVEQVNGAAKAGRVARRDAINTSHPVVRQHPVTKRKALFVNKGFTRSIDGYKKEESDALLQFLFQHTTTAVDYQIRAAWKQYTIVFWDNRATLHSATIDYDADSQPREGFRLTVTGEAPRETL